MIDPAAYAAAKRAARQADPAGRASLAARHDTPPELLCFLAADPAEPVRLAVAGNAAAPALADRLLATDADPRVRTALAGRLAGLLPGLSERARERVQRHVVEILRLLVADCAAEVRAAIAEAVKAVPDAPRDLILRLASDTEMPVAEPILLLSPVLTEADLLALIAGPPVPETLAAVARRPGLSEVLADALVATADEPAITALLENPTAAIAESTLDGLITAAAGRLGWQERLVRRPRLSQAAQRALAATVADHLLAPLAGRPDVDPAVATALRPHVDALLVGRPVLAAAPMAHPALADEPAFLAAARQGDAAACIALLARRTRLPPELVARAARLRSTRAVVALCWQAEWPPRIARVAQVVLCGVAPEQVLGSSVDGGWPLGEAEMRWQIDQLRDAA